MGRHNRSEEALFDFIPNKNFSCLIRRGDSRTPSEPPLDPPLLWVIRISILPLNSPKLEDFQPRILSSRKKVFLQAKIYGGNCPFPPPQRRWWCTVCVVNVGDSGCLCCSCRWFWSVRQQSPHHSRAYRACDCVMIIEKDWTSPPAGVCNVETANV